VKASSYELRKFVAPEFIIGVDARLLAGRYAKNFGADHVLIVTDPLIMKSAWYQPVIDSLDAEGIRYTVFSDVTPNPRDHEVMKGAELYERSGCQAIIVIGGGSPIDCAKGIGIVASNKKHVLAFEGVDNVPMPAPPLICIPTTAGTSADVSQFAIITDTTRKVKIAIISKAIVPDIALIDPVPLITLSSELTAYTGMDAITHSVEAFVSNASSPVTDLQAMESIRLMTKYLPLAQKFPDNIDYRYQTMLSSLLAGLAFSNASLGAVHAMAHSLGGLSDLPHGKCNALLLEHVIACNYDSCFGRYDAIASAMNDVLPEAKGRSNLHAIMSAVRSLRDSLEITETLGDMGVTKGVIPELARKAFQDPCMATNPRELTIEDIEKIFENAL
jgi:alcohol dehydrogenase class IV